MPNRSRARPDQTFAAAVSTGGGRNTSRATDGGIFGQSPYCNLFISRGLDNRQVECNSPTATDEPPALDIGGEPAELRPNSASVRIPGNAISAGNLSDGQDGNAGASGFEALLLLAVDCSHAPDLLVDASAVIKDNA